MTPTRGARYRLPERMQLPRLPPRTHTAPARTPHAGTARTYPHPACTQKVSVTVPGNKVFRICQAGARDSGNKIDWSQNGEGGPEAGALGAEAVGVDGCARLPSSAAGMRSVSSTRLRCAWTLWAVSGNPSGIPGNTMGLATGTSARLRAGHDVCRAPGSAARWGRAGRKQADASGRCGLLRGR